MARAHSRYLDAALEIPARKFFSTCAAIEYIGGYFKILGENGEFPAKAGVTISPAIPFVGNFSLVRMKLWSFSPFV
jgi:hypothetical protein